MAYEYTSLSSFLQEKMRDIEPFFIRVDWLLGDDYMHNSVTFRPHKEEGYHPEPTASPAAPLRLLFLGLRRVFSSYLNDDGRVNWEQVLRDLFQPFIGIGNVIRGVFGVIAGVIGFGLGSVVGVPVFLIISLVLSIVHQDLRVFSSEPNHAWPKLGEFLADTLGWIAEGLFQIVRGGTQIVGTPFTWFSMIPRAIATIPTTPPKKDYSKGEEGIDYLVINEDDVSDAFVGEGYQAYSDDDRYGQGYNSEGVQYPTVSAAQLPFNHNYFLSPYVFSKNTGKNDEVDFDEENSQDDNRRSRSPSPTGTPTDSDSDS